MIDEGNHDGCNLIDCECVENRFGNPAVDLKFQLPSGEHRTVSLEVQGDYAPDNFKRLDFLGFNYDTDNPSCDNADDVSLHCKHKTSEKGNLYELWFVNTADSGSKPLEPDMKRRTKALFNQRRRSAPTESKSSGPPAAKSSGPPPAKTTTLMTKELAWTEWEKVVNLDNPDGNKQPDADKWQETIDEIGDEGTFGADEWQQVADKALPF